MQNRIHLVDFVPEGKWFHFAYCTFPKPRSLTPHTHDFVEIFRSVEGTGIHHCNGQDMILKPGDVVFIAPDDAHYMRTIGNRKWTAANLAFSRGIMDDLAKRYPKAMKRMLERDRQGNPVIHSLSTAALEELRSYEQELQAAPQSRLSLDRFLLNFLSLFEQRVPSEFRNPAMPDWLSYAVTEIQHPRHFHDGMRAFVELAGHCQAHVIRETRKWLGKTPGELIHETRLQHARSLLATSNSSLKAICDDCGFKSVSYFHHSFRARFKVTPRQYRLKQQAIATTHKQLT
jgi:AraC family transcriptional regulator, dual regulator of chb operon